MRKLLLVFVLLFSISYGFAQLGEAKNNLAVGTLDKAKTAIDNALNEEKHKNNPNAWFTKGEIYQSINQQVRSGIELYKAFNENAIEDAYLAYKKSIKLADEEIAKEGKGKNKYLKKVAEKIPTLRQQLQGEGGFYYNLKDYAKAVTVFEYAIGCDSLNLVPADTLLPAIYFNTGLCANLAKDFKKAIKYYKAAAEKGYKEDVKIQIIRATTELGDTAAAEKMLREEIGKSDDVNLLIELVNILLKKNESAEAIKYLDKAIANDPKNQSFYYAKGTLFDKQGDPTNAEAQYLKALELKADYWEALYNLGALYVNEANKKIVEASKLPINENKKYDAMIAESKGLFDKAIPYLEAALEKAPKDKSLLQTLREIYLKKQLKDKAKEMQDRIDAL